MRQKVLLLLLALAVSVGLSAHAHQALASGDACYKARPDFGQWAWIHYPASTIMGVRVMERARGAERSASQIASDITLTYKSWQAEGCPGQFLTYLANAWNIRREFQEQWAADTAVNIVVIIIRGGH